jgi:hypothetical protein
MRPRLTSLVLASTFFALVAGVAGWVWGQLFASPSVSAADRAVMLATAACAALAGAASGLLLAPDRGEEGESAGGAVSGVQPRPSAARITAVLLALGAAAGGVGGALRSVGDIALGVGCGFLYAILLTPAAAAVIPIVRRVGRARRGSVVAWADSRALVATTGGVLGATTAVAALNWPAAAVGAADPPRLAVILLIAAAGLVALALVADTAALARVDRWAARLADEESGAPLDLAAPMTGHVDLGVGNDIATFPTPGTAYRGGGRLIASVAGDIDDARTSLRQSIRRGAILLALLDAAGLAHGFARDPSVAAQYDAWLCDGGRVEACRGAALLAERAGLPQTEAARLHDRACSNGQEESCNALVLMDRQAGPPW